jgi:outer membrane protein TolC
MRNRSVSPRWLISALGIVGLVLAFTAVSSPVTIAQQAAPSSQEPAKQPSTTGTADLPPLPLSPIERAEKDGTALPISLKDLTKLALQNNLDIAIQDTNEQLSQQKIIQAYGVYDPTFTATVALNSQKSGNTNLATASTDQAGYNQTERQQWNFGFSQSVKTGGKFEASFNSSRSDNNQAFALFTPQYNGSLTGTFTQPLWRNLKIDSNRGQIKIVNLDLKTSDSQFKQKVTDTIASIQSQYWDLVSAIRDYDIKRKSVELAQITLRDNKKKVEVGTLAPIEVTDAQANMAQREVELITSEERILNQENTLRALISSDRNADIWSRVIVPTDSPEFREYKISLDEAINEALKNRPELEQRDLELQKLDINQQVTENSRKWQVDLTAQLGTTGVSGPQTIKQGVPTIRPELVGGIWNAYQTMFTEGFTNWQVAFSLQIPLRNRTVDAQIAQHQINRRQQLLQRKNTEQSILVDVRNAVQKLDTSKKQVETAGVSRTLSRERLDGETKRFEAGLSQNYLVLQRQNELASAAFTELQALIAYKKAIITLQKAMYTLLESSEFETAKSSSSNVPDLK